LTLRKGYKGAEVPSDAAPVKFSHPVQLEGTGHKETVARSDHSHPTLTSQVGIEKNGTLVGTEANLNLIEGAGITVTSADNPGSSRVDVTLAATAVSGFPGFGTDPAQIDVGDAQAAGTSTTTSHSDHQHALVAPGPASASAVGDTSIAGSSTKVSREDHLHGREGFGAPSTVAASAVTGTATTLPHSDHIHDHGSGYLPDAHHAQSHTLTSHSTRAHSELTGIGTDDHHNKSHVHLADGSGSVAHSSLTGIGANDHHTEDHSIIGTHHTSFPGGTTDFLRADGTFAAPSGGGGGSIQEAQSRSWMGL
jgi:hypothetical protein